MNLIWDNYILFKKKLAKILLFMKFFIITSLISVLQVSASVYSQGNIFSINEENITMRELFNEIEKNSNYSFFYNDKFSILDKSVNVRYWNRNINQVLDDLLENTNLNYRILENKMIVIVPNSELENQQIIVKGKVVDASGSALPGVNIVEKGTTNGVVTNLDGEFTISVGSANSVLAFSFIGFLTEEVEVGTQTSINITLVEDILALDEVVVTALGIKREEKTLTYSNQTVDADELVKTRDVNFMSSLSGKAAGIEIKKSSSGAGGSTRVVLRGSKSLSTDSEPLYVIDGIPMVNNKGGQPGMWGGTDQGDGISQLNPDDIESINILKGSNAAALYGSQGANGVVLITTKSGKEGKAKVTINSGVTFENVMAMPELQYKYGSEGGAQESWSYNAGNYDDTFVEDFFQTGYNIINNVTISGGTERTQAYFSYGNTKAHGIVPTNKYDKNNVTFKQSTKLFNDKVTVSSNVMLAQEETKNRIAAGYYLNPLTGLYFFPRNLDFDSYKDNYEVFDTDRNLMWQNWHVEDHLQSNPYWILNKEPRTDLTKRVISNATINWDITEKLSFSVRGNYDYAIKSYEQKHYAGSNTTNTHENGRWYFEKYNDEMIYGDGILKYNDTFGAVTLNAIAGASYQKTIFGEGISVDTGTDGLIYPNEFYFQNIPTNVMVSSTLDSRLIKQAVFANATVGVKDMIFLDVSGRNDWSSSLAGTGNDSYFYPAFGLTGLLSEMFNLPSFIAFSKVRASYTIVGNEIPYNMVNPQNTINSTGGVSRNTEKPFTNLKPEMLRSLEIGTDWRFFDGRFGFDFTYYNINSQDQFIELDAPSGSGYTTYYVNAGEIVNKGVEITVDAMPVKTNKLAWRTSFNYSRNQNEVIELHPDLSEPVYLSSSEGYQVKIYSGGALNDLYVYRFKRDDEGRIIVDADGTPQKNTSETEYIGSLDPRWSLGWNNNLTFGRFDFSFLISGKFGGKVVSQTEAMLDGYGVSLRTAEARDNGGVSVNAATEDGTAVTTVDPQTWYTTTGNRNGIKEAYTYSRTNVRLSQVSLAYNFDLSKLEWPIENAAVSLVGQNMFFFYKKAPYDPELTMSTNRTYQSLDNFNLPATRTIGFNVKLTF